MNSTSHEHRRWGRRGARVVAVLAVAASAAVVGSVDSSSALNHRVNEAPAGRQVRHVRAEAPQPEQVDRNVAGGRLTYR